MAGFAAGGASALTVGGGALVRYFICMMITCAFLFPLFYFRLMGAGDIKLVSILAGMVGIRTGAVIFLFSLFLAAPFCVIKMIFRNNLRQRLMYFFVYFRRLYSTKKRETYYNPVRDGYENTIPLAVFLLAGTVIIKITA